MFKINQLHISIPDLDVENEATFRILIDGNWDIEDFIECFAALNNLYKFHFWTYKSFLMTKAFIEDPRYKTLTFKDYQHTPIASILAPFRNHIIDLVRLPFKRSFPLTYSPETSAYADSMFYDLLTVKRIRYSSPGITDLVGLSGILQHIKDILFYYFPNKKDKEGVEIIKQQRIELQIKNLKSIGLSDLQIKQLLLNEEINLETISNFVGLGKIDDIQIHETG